MKIYPGTSLACGGCNYCRRNAIPPYQNKIQIDKGMLSINYDSKNQNLGEVEGVLSAKRIIASISSSTTQVIDSIDLLELLLSIGFSQFVLPEYYYSNEEICKMLMVVLSKWNKKPQRTIMGNWLFKQNKNYWQLLPMSTAVIYPTNQDVADEIFQSTGEFSDIEYLIHIVPNSLFLKSRNGLFIEKVDGVNWDIKQLTSYIKSQRDIL